MAALYIKLERLLRWHASKATRPLSGHQVREPFGVAGNTLRT